MEKVEITGRDAKVLLHVSEEKEKRAARDVIRERTNFLAQKTKEEKMFQDAKNFEQERQVRSLRLMDELHNKIVSVTDIEIVRETIANMKEYGQELFIQAHQQTDIRKEAEVVLEKSRKEHQLKCQKLEKFEELKRVVENYEGYVREYKEQSDIEEAFVFHPISLVTPSPQEAGESVDE